MINVIYVYVTMPNMILEDENSKYPKVLTSINCLNVQSFKEVLIFQDL